MLPLSLFLSLSCCQQQCERDKNAMKGQFKLCLTLKEFDATTVYCQFRRAYTHAFSHTSFPDSVTSHTKQNTITVKFYDKQRKIVINLDYPHMEKLTTTHTSRFLILIQVIGRKFSLLCMCLRKAHIFMPSQH